MKKFIFCIGFLLLFISNTFASQVKGNRDIKVFAEDCNSFVPLVESLETDVSKSDAIVQPQKGKSTSVQLFGSIISGKTNGIYSTTLTDPPVIEKIKDLSNFVTMAGTYVNGKYYVISKLDYPGISLQSLDTYDAETWNVVGNLNLFDIAPTSITYNPVDAKVYGCFKNNAGSFEFSTFDLNSGQTKLISSLQQQFVALAANDSGKVYGIAIDGCLYDFDLQTGKTLLIGNTGFVPGDMSQDACFEEGNLYWFARNSNESSVFKVDTLTGNAQKLFSVSPSNLAWAGIFSKSVKFKDEVPSVTDLNIDFKNGALFGIFSFRMPLKTVAGNNFNGKLSYVVFLDDVEFKVGEANAGDLVQIPVDIQTVGFHKFSVYSEYKGVSGPIVYINKFIGQDIVKKTENVSAVKSEGTNDVIIKWSPVTEGVNGGYIDLNSIRYSIKRIPDNVVIADGLVDTSYTDKSIHSMNVYCYEIVATDGLTKSESVRTNEIVVGEDIGIVPPYDFSFLGSLGLGFFITIDANGDGITWTHNEQKVYCPTHETKADDWLVSPKIRLEKGKYYHVSMLLMASTNNKQEKFEVLFGKSAEVPSMINVICPQTTTKTNYLVDKWISPQETGIYYIGIHAMSDANSGALGIMNFMISAGVAKDAPNMVENLKATGAANGELLSHIEFTCPKKTFGDEVLQDISKVEVQNITTENVIACFSDVKPGSNQTLSDKSPIEGMNKYVVTCYNGLGAGVTASIECWVGYDIPGSPLNAKWIQKDNQTIITWDMPRTGKHGGCIDTTNITYSIQNVELDFKVKSNLVECTFVDTPTLSGFQTSLLYGIYAHNDKGVSDVAYTNYSAFGIPYDIPFTESFANQKLQTNPWILRTVSGNNLWQLISGVDNPKIISQDNDNGMLAYCISDSGVSRIESPIINISELKKPVVRFWYYMLDKSTDLNVQVSNDCGVTWEDVASVSKVVLNQWNLVTVDFSNYKQYNHLQVGIQASNTKIGYPVLLDNFTVDNNLSYDLAIVQHNIPSSIDAGSVLKYSLNVANTGSEILDNYKVECYINDELVTTVDGKQLQPGQIETFNFENLISVDAFGQVNLLCKVINSKDENLENNKCQSVIKIIESQYPTPADLVLSKNDNEGLSFFWQAAAESYTPYIEDDLEKYESWTVGGIDVVEDPEIHKMVVTQDEGNIGGFKLIDNDHLPTQYIMGAWGKPIPHLGDGMVCQVIDIELYDNSNSSIMSAHSGNKLFCFWTSAQNDDYLIFPELSASNKHISFWAKSLSNRYGLETFEIVVSSTGTAVEDFETFTVVKNVPTGYNDMPESGYTYYEFDLPEKAKYVAIHYVSKDILALLVDDIKYTPADSYKKLDLQGYNMYRNKVKINNSLIKETSFVDKPFDDNFYSYNVTAVFKEGESRFSNTVDVNYLGIEETLENKEMIYVEDQSIVLSGFERENVYVYSMSGTLLKQCIVDGYLRIPMSDGTYLVKIGNHSRILFVK